MRVRDMDRQLADLLSGADRTAPPRRPRASRWIAGGTIAAVAAAIAVPLALTQKSGGRLEARSRPASNPPAQPSAAGIPTPKLGSITYHPLNAPNVGHEESKHRLLSAVAGPPGSGGFAFLRDSNKQVAKWDPCRPIHYVVNPAYAPAGGTEAIIEAVNTVSQASGLKLVYDGTTNERPSAKRMKYQEDKYGDRWAPVLISWSSPFETPELADDVVGVGGADEYQATASKTPVRVSGSVTIDVLQLQAEAAQLPPGAISHVIEHELGHVLGLAHVADPNALMAPSSNLSNGPQAGDLRGFAQAGAGSCHPEI